MSATNTKPLDRTFYVKSQQKFVDLAKTYPDILAVYSAGTIKHPGISDLDFVVCLKDRLTSPLDLENRLPADVASLITTGSILKVNESAIADIGIIDEFPLRLLYGEQYQFNQYNDLTYLICRVLDWLPERFFVLNRFQWESEADILHGLRILKSFSVSLNFLKQITGDTQYDQFMNSLATLRDRWFTKPDTDAFSQLWNSAREIAAQALNDFDRWLGDNNFIAIEAPDKKMGFSIPRGPSFVFGSIAKPNGDNVVVPWTVAAFLTTQAGNGRGFITQNIGRCFSAPIPLSSCQVNSDLRQTILARMNYVESLAAFFRANDLTRGLLKYGWFLNK